MLNDLETGTSTRIGITVMHVYYPVIFSKIFHLFPPAQLKLKEVSEKAAPDEQSPDINVESTWFMKICENDVPCHLIHVHVHTYYAIPRFVENIVFLQPGTWVLSVTTTTQ